MNIENETKRSEFEYLRNTIPVGPNFEGLIISQQQKEENRDIVFTKCEACGIINIPLYHGLCSNCFPKVEAS